MKPPRTIKRLSIAAILSLLGGLVSEQHADAASTAWVGDNHAAVRLITATDAVSSTSSLEAGLEFRYAPGWHGYWRTPGDAGVPPVLDWSGTPGLSAATISWPAPRRVVIEGLQNSVYEGRVVLPVRLAFAAPLGADRGASADLHAVVDYAACSNVCVPFHADLALSLPSGTARPSAEASDIAAAVAAVPGQPATVGLAVVGQTVSGTAPDRKLVLSLRSDAVPFDQPDLFIEGAGSGIPAAPTVELRDRDHTAVLTVDLGDAQFSPRGSVMTLVDGSRSAEFAGPSPAPVVAGGVLWPALLSALLGGMILNLMPCVLPVLSIKLVGLTRQSGAGRRVARFGFFVTGLGIVSCFLLIAVALIVLKWSGASLGWGIQFQQPWFLAAMAALTVTFAASLFDWIHIGVPQLAVDLSGHGTGASRDRRAQWVEPFLTGAFATLLATPCSAPFVGTAVGFALAGSVFDILAIFLCLGLGMALPFLAAALVPGVAGVLPKPGPWMITLRRILGVLLLGTAAWLLAILWTVVGVAATVGTGILLVGILALLKADASRQRSGGPWPKRAAAIMGLLAIAAAVSLPRAGVAGANGPEGGLAFDPSTIDKLVGEGKTVLVDVSASWCLTCKVNELAALDTAEVRARLARPDTVLMRADWSRPDPVVARYIQSFARFGIPLDVVYGPRRPAGEPLPELLTSGIVVSALDGVAQEEKRAAGAAGDGERAP